MVMFGMFMMAGVTIFVMSQFAYTMLVIFFLVTRKINILDFLSDKKEENNKFSVYWEDKSHNDFANLFIMSFGVILAEVVMFYLGNTDILQLKQMIKVFIVIAGIFNYVYAAGLILQFSKLYSLLEVRQ